MADLDFSIDIAAAPNEVFAFVVPLLLYAFYFITIALTDQSWWKVHSVTGAIFAAGITGLLLSYLVFPPAIPSAAR